MANENLRQMKQDSYPWIDFKRVFNPHMSDEREEVSRTYLFDRNGSIMTFVDVNWLQGCMNKGWEVVGYKNFDVKKPDGTYWEEVLELLPIVGQSNKLSNALKELETLKAEHAAAIAMSDPGRLSATKMENGDMDVAPPAALHSYPAAVRDALMKGEMSFQEAADAVFESPRDGGAKAPAGYAEGSQPVVANKGQLAWPRRRQKMAAQDQKSSALDHIRSEWKKQEEREGRNPTGRDVERKGSEIAEKHDRDERERKR